VILEIQQCRERAQGQGVFMETKVRRDPVETYAYAILTNRNQTRSRLGWVSFSTGVTYCGICLRAPVEPEVGTTCVICGASVTRIFELAARQPELIEPKRNPRGKLSLESTLSM
jgi:hypothetical protein